MFNCQQRGAERSSPNSPVGREKERERGKQREGEKRFKPLAK